MQQSHRHIAKDGTVTLTGPDAMEFFRVIQLRGAITLYAKTKMIPTRGITITKMLRAASAITGKKYSKTQDDYARAVADLQVWIGNMQSALPTTDERETEEAQERHNAEREQALNQALDAEGKQ